MHTLTVKRCAVLLLSKFWPRNGQAHDNWGGMNTKNVLVDSKNIMLLFGHMPLECPESDNVWTYSRQAKDHQNSALKLQLQNGSLYINLWEGCAWENCVNLRSPCLKIDYNGIMRLSMNPHWVIPTFSECWFPLSWLGFEYTYVADCTRENSPLCSVVSFSPFLKTFEWFRLHDPAVECLLWLEISWPLEYWEAEISLSSILLWILPAILASSLCQWWRSRASCSPVEHHFLLR